MTDLYNALQPCDILLFKYPQVVLDDLIVSTEDWAADKVIQADSKDVFCQKLPPEKVDCLYHHQEIWFDPTHVFSMQPPRANWFTQTDLDNDEEDKIISVFRMNPAFWGRELDSLDVLTMWKAAQAIIDTKQPYSIGQLLNILIDTIAGHPNDDSVQVFTWSDKRLVCSVAVHAIIFNWINSRASAGEIMPVPYSKLNPQAWSDDFIKKFKSPWALHSIFPCHPAVSATHFQNEWNKIGEFQGNTGKQIA